MNPFEKYFGDTYDFVDVIKSDEKNFVALAYDKNSKRLCAIKKRNLKSAEIYKILKELKNSHIPEIYRLIEHNGNLIVVEEHVDGQTLEEILTYKIFDFDEKIISKILMQICDCLKEIHEKNIIHRDLTLSNIMLTKNNEVKIIDFGIARIFDPQKISDTEFLGTRGYAAPEQYGLFDLEQSDFRTDIFVLGNAMKKLLNENYHGGLEKILNRCTNLNPDLRYQNISELVRDIKRTRKIYFLKRTSFIFLSAVVIFFAVQLANKPEKSKDENLESEIVQETEKFEEEKFENDIPAPEKKSDLSDELTKNLSDFTKNQNSDVKINSNVKEIPQEISPPQKNSPVKEKAERTKIYFYLNGELTENYGVVSGIIFLPDYRNWKVIIERGNEYFIFPPHWTGRFKVENFTGQDLITPRFEISLTDEEIFIDKPTIKSGETIYIDVPLGGKKALPILGENHIGEGHIDIYVKSPSSKITSSLIRYLKADE